MLRKLKRPGRNCGNPHRTEEDAGVLSQVLVFQGSWGPGHPRRPESSAPAVLPPMHLHFWALQKDTLTPLALCLRSPSSKFMESQAGCMPGVGLLAYGLAVLRASSVFPAGMEGPAVHVVLPWLWGLPPALCPHSCKPDMIHRGGSLVTAALAPLLPSL